MPDYGSMDTSPPPESSPRDTATSQAEVSWSDTTLSSVATLPPAASPATDKEKDRSLDATKHTICPPTESPAADGHASDIIPPPPPGLNDLDDWSDSEDGPNYNIVAEDSLEGFGEEDPQENDASIVESILGNEVGDCSNILGGLDCVVGGSVDKGEIIKGRDVERKSDEGGGEQAEEMDGMLAQKEKQGKGKEKGKKERTPRVYEEVSLDDLAIDVWDMPPPWAKYVGRNIHDTRRLYFIHEGTKCRVSHIRGVIDDREVRFIRRNWPQNKLDGFLREVHFLADSSVLLC